MKSVDIEVNYGNHYVRIDIWGEAEALYDKWNESGLDSDFHSFADYVIDDVVGAMDIEITGAE